MNTAQPHGSPVTLDWMGYGAAAMSAGSWPGERLADGERPHCLPSPPSTTTIHASSSPTGSLILIASLRPRCYGSFADGVRVNAEQRLREETLLPCWPASTGRVRDTTDDGAC